MLAQTYFDWELLLVDDGSTDGSKAIVEQFAKQYPTKIFCLEHEGRQNLGMSASRNLGIYMAKGEFIAFLDADDVWLPSKLQQQVSIMSDEPSAGMIYGRTLIWHSWTGEAGDLQCDYTMELGVQPNRLVEPPHLFFLMLENKVQSPTTCNVLIRRSVFKCIGTFEERFRGMYEDQAWFAKVQLKVPVYVSGECWAKYRQHSNSCSALADRTTDYESSRLPLLNWLADYILKEGMGPNSKVWRMVQRERWLCQHPRIRRYLNSPGMLAWQVRTKLRLGGQRGSD